ncbi:MAG TPA: V-type ATP synthase subunit K [Candidatus Peribacteraceae bacterium]|nr:V-type ATP synthase subunit K [Candidatus Peribacteraceae bacterium]
MRKITPLITALALAVPAAAFAQTPTAAVATSAPLWGMIIAFVGAGMATILPSLGSILGVSMVGQAGAGLLTEKPDLAGRVITLEVLPGSQGLYGMVISLLFIFNYAAVISGKTPIDASQGWILFAAFLPVTITCITSAIYQAKVCTAGMHMLAKDGKLTGRVITMAALVETYALLGFLISFFMLNSFRASIAG